MGLRGATQTSVQRHPSGHDPHVAVNTHQSPGDRVIAAAKRLKQLCGTLNLLLLGVVLILYVTFHSGSSVFAAGGAAMSGRDSAPSANAFGASLHQTVKNSEVEYRARFTLREEDSDVSLSESNRDLFGFSSDLYDDTAHCQPRTVENTVFSSELATPSSDRGSGRLHLCTVVAPTTQSSNSSAGRKGRTLVPWQSGTDRWIHPYVLGGDQGNEDADAAMAQGDVGGGAAANAPGTYFARHPANTKVLRNVLYFRRVKEPTAEVNTFTLGERHTDPATQPSEALLPSDDGSKSEPHDGDGTDVSSRMLGVERRRLPRNAPNEVSERFVVASVDGYHTDRDLYRRLTDSEAQRAIKHFRKLKKAGKLKGYLNFTSDSVDADEAAQDNDPNASPDHINQVDSNFVGSRAQLTVYRDVNAVHARTPDANTLGDGVSSQDFSVVDTARFMKLADRLEPPSQADFPGVAMVTALPRATSTSDGAAGGGGGSSSTTSSPAGAPAPMIAHAVLVNLRTCLANHWHGTAEFALPLFALMLRHGMIQRNGKATAVALPTVFVRAPSRSVWGLYNRGCPTLNQWPYGSSADGAWILRTVAPALVFVDEKGDHRRRLEARPVQPLNASVGIANLVVSGLDYSCGGMLDAMTYYQVETRFSRSETPPLGAYPFLLLESHRCDGFLTTFRQFMLERHAGALHNATVTTKLGWVTPLEALCPVVVVLARQGSKNGRHIVNFEHVMRNVRSLVEDVAILNGCPDIPGGRVTEAKLHRLSPAEQLRVLSTATVLMAVRGAATIAAAFVRPGAAVVTLTPAHYSVPLSFRNDNVPWWPFYTLRKDVIVAMGVCKAIPVYTASAHFRKLCQKRSVNFCDADCDSSQVEALLRSALAAQSELVLEAALLRRAVARTKLAAEETPAAANAAGDDEGAGTAGVGGDGGGRSASPQYPVAWASLVEGNVGYLFASRAAAAEKDGVHLWSLPRSPAASAYTGTKVRQWIVHHRKPNPFSRAPSSAAAAETEASAGVIDPALATDQALDAVLDFRASTIQAAHEAAAPGAGRPSLGWRSGHGLPNAACHGDSSRCDADARQGGGRTRSKPLLRPAPEEAVRGFSIARCKLT
jgi:hypothetical protein